MFCLKYSCIFFLSIVVSKVFRVAYYAFRPIYFRSVVSWKEKKCYWWCRFFLHDSNTYQDIFQLISLPTCVLLDISACFLFLFVFSFQHVLNARFSFLGVFSFTIFTLPDMPFLFSYSLSSLSNMF